MVFYKLKVKQQAHIYISASIKQPVASSGVKIPSDSSETPSS